MIKLLIGGSPCTHWSIAQTKNRETKPEGLGWELFRNYLIALDIFQPDYFLYENNYSMASAIRNQITSELGVEPIMINSARLSAQNRKRLYWVGQRNPDGTYSTVPVKQPQDRGILLRDILESGVCGQGGGMGAKTGLYAVPIETPACLRYERTDKAKALRKQYEAGEIKHGYHEFHELHPRPDGKSNTLTTVLKDNMIIENAHGKQLPIYEVKNGQITIKGKTYPINLSDGLYTVRKLTVTECKRLQTVPDEYIFPVSNTQAYKMLGNGWTVDVIVHILSHIDGVSETPIDVLSMYDGMSCGQIALNKLGCIIERYRASEIDKYAIKTTQYNYPSTVQMGDAFDIERTLRLNE